MLITLRISIIFVAVKNSRLIFCLRPRTRIAENERYVIDKNECEHREKPPHSFSATDIDEVNFIRVSSNRTWRKFLFEMETGAFFHSFFFSSNSFSGCCPCGSSFFSPFMCDAFSFTLCRYRVSRRNSTKLLT